jgi:hypothetical protein
VALASARAFADGVEATAPVGAALARVAENGVFGTALNASARATPAPAKRVARSRIGLMRLSSK